MQEKKINFLNSEINYKQFGNYKAKETILILHGWGGSSNSWIKVAELLEKKWYNIIVPDLPWFWETGIYKIFTLDNYAEVIEKLATKLKLKNVILWWHSNWGAISIKLITRNILKPNILVLNNSAWIRNDKKRNFKRKFFHKVSSTIKAIAFLKTERILFVRRIFYKLIWSRDYLEAEKNPFLKQTYLNMISSDLNEEIKKIDIKTFLIWWKKDTYTPISDWKLMSKNIKKSKMIVLEKETHWIHIKNPELLIKAFLKLKEL